MHVGYIKKKRKENEFCCCVEDGLEECKGGSKEASEEIMALSRREGMVAKNSGGREDSLRRWDNGCGRGQQPGRVVGWGLWE